jgi:exonuclease SbcC
LESVGEEVLPDLKKKKQKLDTELEELNRKLRFADVRDELVEGEPCPVCGADEHPYRRETPTEDVSDDDRQRRDEVRSELEDLREHIRDNEGKIKVLERSVEEAEEELESSIAELEDIEDEIDDAREAFNKTLGSIDVDFDDDLSPADRIEVAEKQLCNRKEEINDEEDALLDAKEERDEAKEAYESKREKLEEARDAYEEWVEALDQLDEDIGELENEIEDLEAELGEQATELVEQFEEVDIDVDWSDDNVSDISGFEDSLAEAEEQYESFESAEQKVEGLESEIESLENELDSHIQSWEYAWERLNGTYDESRETIRRIDKLENNLRDEIKSWVEDSEYFDSIDAANQALLDVSELNELEQLCEELEAELEEAEDNLEQLKKQRAEHGEDKPEQLDTEEAERSEIEDEVGKLSEEKSEKREKVGELTSELEQKEKILKKRSDKQEELEALEERKQNIVDPMYELVGKSDGDKFKRFVQALNLQKIVVQANQYLESLRDRYRLDVATGKHGFPELDFSVIDRFHGGRKRDPGTLSGGETFLVSLSLALALADQRHLNLPIETLFLDEGFGTLDQDALDTAVNTLNQLHHTLGRTVGIISHVSGLAEKIPEHIVVRKCGEGRSTIDMSGFHG